MLGGEREAVADEDERCVDGRAGSDMRAYGEVVVLAGSKVQGGAGAQRGRRVVEVDGDLVERHGLKVAAGSESGRLEADGLELLLDVSDGGVEAGCAGAAALKIVGGEVLDVGEPGLAAGVPVGRAGS